MSDFLHQIQDWLDTETRAMLCPSPPPKQTAIGTEAYSLLLLKHGSDTPRVEETVAQIRDHNPVLLMDVPFVVAQEMTLNEALAGQFALACCDCVSAFVRDDVICNATRKELQQLSQEITSSSEFSPVELTILTMPNTDQARRFCWQFLGLAAGVKIPSTRKVFRKKARLMCHWAERSGIETSVEDSNGDG
jgi:hypothetical protein